MQHRSLSAALAASALILAGPALSPSPAAAGTSPGGLLGGLTSTLASTVDGLLADSVPAWAHGSHAAVPGSPTLTFAVQLPTRNQAQLAQLVQRVNDPSSSAYHHYLTPQQYAEAYGPSAANVSAVRSALAGLGLTVQSATAHGTVMVVSGPASAVGTAFGTAFGAFQHDGTSLVAPLSAPRLPAALHGLVANVDGLAQELVRPSSATPQGTPDGFAIGEPCSSYYGEKQASDQPSYEGASAPYATCGYTAKQLRSAYGLQQTGLTGKGASIGIVDAWASATALQDANQLAANQGEQPFADGQFVENIPVGLQQAPDAGTLPGLGELGAVTEQLLGLNVGDLVSGLFSPTDWVMEEELDIEAVHAMAPDAKVVYQGAVTPYPSLMYAADAALIEQGQVQAISNSFGMADDDPLPTDEALFDALSTQAAATGITMAFASGDSGDNSQTGTRAAQFPATSDQVLAVGGTTAHIGADGTLDDETYWGTDQVSPTADGSAWDVAHATFTSGGGGGVSTLYAEPGYQQGVVPQSLATFGGVPAGRVVPDVSMAADPTSGMRVGTTMAWADGSTSYGEYRIGGTSLACPLMAGTLALAIQAAGGQGFGNVNPALYGAASQPGGLDAAFNDPSAAPVDAATGISTLAQVRTDHTVADDPTSPSSVVHLMSGGNLQTLHALPGYDDSTGLGTPKAAGLVSLLVPSWTPPAG